jgi:hypothetical protein
MSKGRASDLLVNFVEHVHRKANGSGRDLTVMDLRLAVREQRLTEYADWSASALDQIEEEAALCGDTTPLRDIVSPEFEMAAVAASVTWPHSPSPVAWM